MAIRYIPTEYKRPTPSTLGLWSRSMQPLLQMFIQHNMQKDMLDKQIDVDKTRVDAANKEWDRRFDKTKRDTLPSLAKTLYDEYGLIKMGNKGFAKFDKKSGKISMVSPPEADNIKNEQLAKWIADKTLIPVDANYPAGSPVYKYQDTNYYHNPKPTEKETPAQKLQRGKDLAKYKAGLPPKPTDADDYVADKALAYKKQTGKKATPEMRAKWRIEYKKANPFLDFLLGGQQTNRPLPTFE